MESKQEEEHLDPTPITIGYKNIRMEGNKRIGECPRGKNIKCKKCTHFIIRTDPTNAMCLDFELKNINLSFTGEERNNVYVHYVSYRDAYIVKVGIDVKITSKIADVKNEHHRAICFNTIAYIVGDRIS